MPAPSAVPQTGYLPNYPAPAAQPQTADTTWMPNWLRDGAPMDTAMPPQPQADVRIGSLPPVAESTAPRTSGRFEWPVMGRVISGYGPKPGGEHNDGINIAVPAGTPVRAAEDGTVVYADNELKGFGNLLLVRHKDRWMTAYAHLDRMAVKSGDKVKRGQTIGTVGATGTVDKPQLHFEVRRGTEALNPEIYMQRVGS
jgi:murein DD-endopeptidase MepM/ murein hydrolase activator NlpD